jgi:protein-tyrosine-phosphatase
MAEGLLRRVGGESFEVFSAGADPRPIHPLAIEVMARAGIDITSQRSKDVASFKNESFDFVITVGDETRTSCPVFPGQHRLIHWRFADPATATGTPAEIKKAFARVRDEIAGRVRLFAYAQTRKKARKAAPTSRLLSESA